MSKLELAVSILALAALVGIIVLSALDKEIAVLVPTLSALIAFLLGSKKEVIARIAKKAVGK